MTMTVANVEVEVSRDPERRLSFAVELDDSSAVVRYRSKFLTSEADIVLWMTHERGRIREVRWAEHWRRYWAPPVRSDLIGRVQQLLIEQYRQPDPDG